MGVLLSLGDIMLIVYSDQSLISRCYNLMLSEPTKWTANKVAISVSTLHRRLASEGVSFQSY